MPNLTVDFNDTDRINKIMRIYKKYGIVVIENVLADEKCDGYVDKIMDCFEGFGTGIRRKDQKTWTRDSLPPQTRPGMFQALCANFPPVWDVRTEQNIQTVYQEVYTRLRNKKVTDMIVSGDAINVKPSQVGPFYSDSIKDWPHLDQTFGDVFKCVQGQMVLTNTTACFLATPGSHKQYNKLREEFGIKDADRSNWYKFSDEDIEKAKKLFKHWQIPIRAKKGSLILWTSTTIHSAQYAEKNPKVPVTKTKDKYYNWRCVVYVCYRPREDFTAQEIRKRYECYKNNRTTNHWSTKVMPKNPVGRYVGLSTFKAQMQQYIEKPELMYDKKIFKPKLRKEQIKLAS